MTTPADTLSLADGLIRQRPLLRRFRERMRVYPPKGSSFEFRIELGGLGFKYTGALLLDERQSNDHVRWQLELFLPKLEQGFVDEYDRHRAKLEAA